jgi:hypothetical protein
VEAVCVELMEIEVSQQIGAERGERRPDDRMTLRSCAVPGRNIPRHLYVVGV